MSNTMGATRSGNRLLDEIPSTEYGRLLPHLQAVALPVDQYLYRPLTAMDYVYFPVSGIASAMTVMENGGAIEVATIGNEGVVGFSAFLGEMTSTLTVTVQVPGHALRMRAEIFRDESNRTEAFKDVLIRYNRAFMTQVFYAVACNGLHKVEQRCCRWLLTTADRLASHELPLRHEFLAIMLGVRRASVTEVLQPLQEKGMLNYKRGKIRIIDRAALEATACECYHAVRAEFARLFGDK